jgi:ribosomal protein S18 acetylase RimI-like enzyme
MRFAAYGGPGYELERYMTFFIGFTEIRITVITFIRMWYKINVMNIRLADTNDYNGILKLWCQNIQYHCANLGYIYNESTEDDLRNDVLSNLPYLINIVLEEDDKILGFVNGRNEFIIEEYKRKRSSFRILNLVVDERYRHKGYGKKLLSTMLELIKGLNKYEDVVIDVGFFNKNAITLYESMGFSGLSQTMLLKINTGNINEQNRT